MKQPSRFFGFIIGALAALSMSWALLSPPIRMANAAGTIPVALSQQFNANGQPLVGCFLYLFVTGTVATPQLAFQDSGLTQALPWPLVCDANGRLPMFYLADGAIHPRLTDANGLVQFDYPSMLVIGGSITSGASGGGTIDPTTISATGDIKFRPTGETLTGWVKANGTSIGSAVSGATGRANADTQNLYVYLWTNCINAFCVVQGGRGVSALVDFNANKQLFVYDFRGRAPFGLDDMGNTAAGILDANDYFLLGGSPTTPGSYGGVSVLPSGGTPAVPSTGALLGTGTGVPSMNPFILGTWYIKL